MRSIAPSILKLGHFFLETSSLKGSWVSLRKPSFWREDDFALHQEIAQPNLGRPSCSKVRGDTKTLARPSALLIRGSSASVEGEYFPPQLIRWIPREPLRGSSAGVEGAKHCPLN